MAAMPAFGTVDAATAARLADDSARPEKAVGTGAGQSSRNPYGAAYEHNRRLASHADRAARERESLTHWSVAAVYDAVAGLCRIPTWKMRPADEDSPRAVRNADHAAACLGLGDTPSPIDTVWQTKLGEWTLAKFLGFGLWELVCERVGGVWYTHMEARDQGSITGWVVDARGRLVAADQQATWGGIVTIPAGQFLHFVAGAVAADDYSGRGLARCIEPQYRDVVALQQASIAGARRFSVPSIDITIDVEKAERAGVQVTESWINAELAKWYPTGSAYLAHERGVVARPPWIIIGTVGADAKYQPEQIEIAIDARDRRILSPGMAHWMMFAAPGSGGTYNLTEQVIEAAHDKAQAECEDWCGVMAQFAKRAVRWQYGEQEPDELMPKLTADGLSSEAFVEWIKSGQFATLVQCDAIRMDDGLRDAVRRAGEAPPEDPENRPQARPAAAPAAAPQGGGLPMVLPRRLQQAQGGAQ